MVLTAVFFASDAASLRLSIPLTLKGACPPLWRRKQGLSGGAVGRREPMVCAQLTSVAVR